jgi:hypothetical protein
MSLPGPHLRATGHTSRNSAGARQAQGRRKAGARQAQGRRKAGARQAQGRRKAGARQAQGRRKAGVKVERVAGSPFVEHVVLAKVVVAEVFKAQNLQ